MGYLSYGESATHSFPIPLPLDFALHLKPLIEPNNGSTSIRLSSSKLDAAQIHTRSRWDVLVSLPKSLTPSFIPADISYDQTSRWHWAVGPDLQTMSRQSTICGWGSSNSLTFFEFNIALAGIRGLTDKLSQPDWRHFFPPAQFHSLWGFFVWIVTIL